jgi:xanthine dehydrogenase YagS FAD-binding subunit
MAMPNFTYVRAKSLREAVQQLSAKEARLHAGGTDLLGCLRDEVFTASKIVSIGQLNDLRGIREMKGGGVRIGALTSIAEVAGHPLIRKQYPALAKGAGEVASPALRNQGTLGGNICQKPRCWYYRGEFHCLRKGGDRCYAVQGENHYHCLFGSDQICYIVHPSDTAPALLAYEATVRIAGPKGTRRVPIDRFFVRPGEDFQKETVLDPGEIVMEIFLPPAVQGVRSSYRKIQARRSWDFALVGVALALQFDGEELRKARVVLSGAAPIPWRSKEAEEVLTGKKLDGETISKAAKAAMEKAQPLAHNGYKVPLFRGMIEEELQAMARG